MLYKGSSEITNYSQGGKGVNRILIVEDEKMIRQGIVAMLKRMPVTIGEIFESRNGEEALEILKNNNIDLMITDIRMPRMDGITLVKKIQELPNKPMVIVVSGYDDFNYAVEVLRQGVRDYLLKPIEREKFTKVIMQIQQEIESRREETQMEQKIGSQQLKYLLLNKEITAEEITTIEKQFSKMFPSETYILCCMNEKPEFVMVDPAVYYLSDMEGQCLILLEPDKFATHIEEQGSDYGMGISSVHKGISELPRAYQEALFARKEAFVKCLPFHYYEDFQYQYETIPDDFPQQFVQLFGTQKVEDGLKKFGNIRFKARMNRISSDTLIEITRHILEQLIENYERIIEFDMEEFQKLREPLRYQSADQYYELLDNWIRTMQQLIMEEFDDYKNKEKINMAIQYIKDHYKTELNMAVVSNMISMNYSLFSLNFKQYTGMNFVNYLKKIRIDEAKRLLEETEEKIIDISQMVGYDNEKHFMKTFKSVCGVSPSEYRKNSWYHKKPEKL